MSSQGPGVRCLLLVARTDHVRSLLINVLAYTEKCIFAPVYPTMSGLCCCALHRQVSADEWESLRSVSFTQQQLAELPLAERWIISLLHKVGRPRQRGQSLPVAHALVHY